MIQEAESFLVRLDKKAILESGSKDIGATGKERDLGGETVGDNRNKCFENECVLSFQKHVVLH